MRPIAVRDRSALGPADRRSSGQPVAAAEAPSAAGLPSPGQSPSDVASCDVAPSDVAASGAASPVLSSPVLSSRSVAASSSPPLFPPASSDPTQTSPSSLPLPLRIEALRFQAGGRVILDIPHLTVPAGGFVVLRGASGAGKSTALALIAGIATPAQGRVLWGDLDLAALSPSGRRQFRRDRLGLVFQDYRLFPEMGAQANAALAAGWAPRADRAHIRAAAARALAALGLAQAQARPAAVMSGGERQRIAVARALATRPAAILADEPTASLDRANADRLADDLAALSGAHTLIVVSHDPAMQARAGRIVTLADGRIVEDTDA